MPHLISCCTGIFSKMILRIFFMFIAFNCTAYGYSGMPFDSYSNVYSQPHNKAQMKPQPGQMGPQTVPQMAPQSAPQMAPQSAPQMAPQSVPQMPSSGSADQMSFVSPYSKMLPSSYPLPFVGDNYNYPFSPFYYAAYLEAVNQQIAAAHAAAASENGKMPNSREFGATHESQPHYSSMPGKMPNSREFGAPQESQPYYSSMSGKMPNSREFGATQESQQPVQTGNGCYMKY